MLKRRARFARLVLAGAAAAAVVYIVALLGLSAASREQVAGRGDEKYFCEVDCHLAYSVLGVSEARSLGSGGDRAAARGVFRVVTLRVRFDEDTISSHRARDLPLTPTPRLVRIVDSSGAAYPIDPAGQKALEAAEGEEIPLSRPLKAGESYRTRLVFDLPEEARDPRLLLTEDSLVTRVLIGHENSLFHRKVFFAAALF
ncbi:MAG: DUF4352 domain-containing protein [Acidobacteriota bacterium]|nr:DUF4352 domain-containing protein [Acidobacteriota bacterium]